jgi:RimJ/RimL family protein N-acetyltransferase
VRVTERLVLRPFTRETAETILSGERDALWAVDYPTPGDQVISRHVLKAAGPLTGPWLPYQMSLRDSGLVVGGAGYHSIPSPEGTVEIGYGVAPSAQRRGYATEAAHSLIELARDLGAKRVVAHTDGGNAGSRAVLDGLGFRLARAEDGVEDGYLYVLELL